MNKTIFSNVMFSVFSALFMIALFSVSPPTPMHANDPGTRTGLSYAVQPDSAAQLVSLPADAPPVVDLEWLLTKENAIASLVMLLLTFLSKWLPGLAKIPDTGKRALVVAVTVIAGFLAVKFIGPGTVSLSDFAGLAITYLLTALGYDKGLKPIGLKTPR